MFLEVTITLHGDKNIIQLKYEIGFNNRSLLLQSTVVHLQMSQNIHNFA